MSKFLWLLGAGHGGMIDGKYQTAGKRSPKWDKGVYYEGVGNRDFVKRILKELRYLQIECLNPYDTEIDVPLRERVAIINALFKYNKRIRFISVHSNAGGGTGFSIYTSRGRTKSDQMATMYYEEITKIFPNIRFRSDFHSDGDADKERDFYMLSKTNCPAILSENLFMDHKGDYEKLFDPNVRYGIVLAHVNTILRVEGLATQSKLHTWELG